jgi:hypothetical protein
VRLICPECGAAASAAAWSNDAEIREVIGAIVTLPAPVAGAVLPYLSLFRPESRALSWKRARTVVVELAAQVAAGIVQIQGKPARRCPANLWAQGMEGMTARRDRLQLPLKNHNYLRTVVWPLAEQAAAAAEKIRNQAEAEGGLRRADQRVDDDQVQPVDVRACLDELKKRNANFR